MPPFGPISQRDLIGAQRQLGFEGPIPGARHRFTIKGALKLRIPNPHQRDIRRDLLARILREAGISRDEWEAI